MVFFTRQLPWNTYKSSSSVRRPAGHFWYYSCILYILYILYIAGVEDHNTIIGRKIPTLSSSERALVLWSQPTDLASHPYRGTDHDWSRSNDPGFIIPSREQFAAWGFDKETLLPLVELVRTGATCPIRERICSVVKIRTGRDKNHDENVVFHKNFCS